MSCAVYHVFGLHISTFVLSILEAKHYCRRRARGCRAVLAVPRCRRQSCVRRLDTPGWPGRGLGRAGANPRPPGHDMAPPPPARGEPHLGDAPPRPPPPARGVGDPARLQSRCSDYRPLLYFMNTEHRIRGWNQPPTGDQPPHTSTKTCRAKHHIGFSLLLCLLAS